MAHVRSVEQQYWNLAQQHVQLWSAGKAVELAREIVNREQAALAAGKGTVADVAEAQQRLEQFNLDLVTRTSDVITTERQLRTILGLPAADNRRIIPVTPPADAKIEPDWNASLATMLESQPDVVQAKERETMQTDLDKVAQTFLPDLGGQGVHAVSSGPERGKSAVLESASLQQVTHQATHSLARFFLEIDANYKQYQTAKKLRVAAAERLEAQRAYYEEGRITIDRFLDSVSQYAAAVAKEAQFKSTYNVSIVALEEAKGTLLDHDKITVVERPVADKPVAGKPDGAVMAASFDTQAPAEPCVVPRIPVEGRRCEGCQHQGRRSRSDDLVPGDDQRRLQASRDPRLLHGQPGRVARSCKDAMITPRLTRGKSHGNLMPLIWELPGPDALRRSLSCVLRRIPMVR